MPRQNHIYSLDTLYRITYDLRRKGKKIALTHGAFDLFHIGHLDLLKRSAAVSDYLIVGVENNKNISDYKDQERPVIDEDDRVEIINSLNCVDAVFVNPYEMRMENYIYLYKNLLADYVTIGPNFEFPEHIHTQAHHSGSQVLSLGVKRFRGSSSSRILERIKRGE